MFYYNEKNNWFKTITYKPQMCNESLCKSKLVQGCSEALRWKLRKTTFFSENLFHSSLTFNLIEWRSYYRNYESLENFEMESSWAQGAGSMVRLCPQWTEYNLNDVETWPWLDNTCVTYPHPCFSLSLSFKRSHLLIVTQDLPLQIWRACFFPRSQIQTKLVDWLRANRRGIYTLY